MRARARLRRAQGWEEAMQGGLDRSTVKQIQSSLAKGRPLDPYASLSLMQRHFTLAIMPVVLARWRGAATPARGEALTILNKDSACSRLDLKSRIARFVMGAGAGTRAFRYSKYRYQYSGTRVELSWQSGRAGEAPTSSRISAPSTTRAHSVFKLHTTLSLRRCRHVCRSTIGCTATSLATAAGAPASPCATGGDHGGHCVGMGKVRETIC